MLTVNSPEPEFSGEVAGVAFTKGEATLDATVHATALAYFRRRGYRVTEAEPEPADEAPAAADAFDPAEHTVADVLAYLADADEDERARVLAAEAAGEARATILKKGTGQ